MKVLNFTSLFVVMTMASSIALAETTKFSGDVVLEYAVRDLDNGVSTQNASTDKVRLAVTKQFSDKLEGKAQILFEENEESNPAKLDEAFLTWHANEKWDVAVGRKYLPFGSYQTKMVTEPLTSRFGKTRADTLQATHKNGAWETSAFAFQNGAKKSGTDSKHTGWGASVGYSLGPMKMGANYTSNIAAAKDRYRSNDATANDTAKPVGAWGYYTIAPLTENITLVSEQMFALNTFKQGDLGGVVTSSRKPKANNTEIDFNVGEDRTVAVSVQVAQNAAQLGFSHEKAYGVAYRTPLYKNTSFAVEYLKTDDHDDNYTAQVAYGF